MIEYDQMNHEYGVARGIKVESDDKLNLMMQFDQQHDKMTLKWSTLNLPISKLINY